MIEEFLQNKLSAILDQFIEFQKLKIDTSEGMTIRNSKVKPKLVQQLSQVLGMPLEHVSGSIDTFSLNVPWKKLFRLMGSEVKLVIQGARLKSKLKTGMSEAYVMRRREQSVEMLTSKLFNPLETSSRNSSFMNAKLKEYFLSTLLLEVKNVQIQIEIDLKHKVELVLRIGSLNLRREHTKRESQSKISLQVQGVGLFYKAAGFKEVALVSPANLSFQRVKSEGGQNKRRVLTHNINIDKIHVHLDNYNYGDIARVLLLINWHNSFIHLPYEVWKVKPSILSECKPSAKFIYCAHLIKESIADNHFKKQMVMRRAYINLYTKLITNTQSFTITDKEQLLSMEKLMPLWRIAAYRSFAINITKFKIEAQRNKKGSPPEKEKQNLVGMANMMNNFWFKRWFSNEKNARELERQFLDKIASIESIPDEVQSSLNVKVETITIAINIITNFGGEPFISLIGYHCQFGREQFLIEKRWSQSLQFRKCKIIFDKYLGHHQNYKNMLCESKDHFGESVIAERDCEEEDEFEDINYFLEMQFSNDSKVINIHFLPFDLYINHEIIEKINILLNLDKLSKLSNMDKIQEAYLQHYDPWMIVQQQKQNVIKLKKSLSLSSTSLNDNILSPTKPLKKQMDSFKQMTPEKDKEEEKKVQKNRIICLKSSANIIVMANSRQHPGTQLILTVGSFEVQIKPSEKIILLEKITLKGKFVPKPKQVYEAIYINMLNKQIYTYETVHKFNVKLELKSHMNFDETFIEVTRIQIDLPPIDEMCSLIELIFMHIPKHKENRVRQYYRRKQSIGQEFMDACENLNEHITKSLVMSSEKMTNRTMLKQKRTRTTSLKLQGIIINGKYAELSLKQFCLTFRQIGYDQRMIESYNEKRIKLTIHNVKQMIKNVKAIEYEIKKQLQQKGLSQGTPKKSQDKFQNVLISHINIDLELLMKINKQNELLGLYLQLKDINYEENQEASARRLQVELKVSYDEVRDHKGKKQIQRIPFIEECIIHQEQNFRFNLTDLSIDVQELAINIKPSLFKTLAFLIKELHIEDNNKYTLVNGLINAVQVKIPMKNFYIDCRHSQKVDLQASFCEVALFKRKFELKFNRKEAQQIPRQTIQCIELGQNNFLINRETAPNHYLLQSNIRIMNHQDRTLWIKLGQNQMNSQVKEGGRFRIPTLSSFQRKSANIDLNQPVSLNSRDYDTLSMHSQRMFASMDRQKSQNRGKSIAVKSKQILHLLVDEEEHKYLQIMDQGSSFTEVSLNDLFESTQLVVQNQDSEENEYLVLRSEISKMDGIEGSIFTFHIYSPVFIANKTPWMLQYRLSAEEDPKYESEENKKYWRRRSFEVLPMKKIPTLYSQKIRGWCYSQIENMRLSVKKYEREFSQFSSLVRSIKKKCTVSTDGFTKRNELITLRNGKQYEIQMVLCLKFTDNIMKIVIYPQYIFANLTSLFMNFRVKEENVTYHQVKLPSLRIDERDKKVRQTHPNLNAYINQLSHLRTEKFKSREVLKQLFETHEGDIETFTGNLSKDIPKKMLFYSGRELIRKQKSFLKATRGYLSDRDVSDTENYDEKKLKSEAFLAENEVIKFGPQQHLIFKRIIQIEKYFTLVVFMPTVHIINKSQATFYAKSQSQTLVKISKESHNYIVTCSRNVDIQACLQDEEISLSEWTKIDLEDLRTIYYSKDMIQHHGSGYESKEYAFRKKRMKKVPKIFYKVIICKYKRGQKILIQESQYPPISFINNTKHRMKIQQTEQRFSQQLLNKGDMGQYAPKDPYHTPQFRLSVAENYQYRQLKLFGVAQKQVFNLDFGINLSIEEYKDKIIINIKQVGDVKLTVSMAERNMLKEAKEIDDKGESLLEEVRKFTVTIKSIVFSLLNNWNRQLNSLVIDDCVFTKENKNYKDYYKLEIKRIQGYDYMGLQPQFIFQVKKREKKIFANKPRQSFSNYFQFSVVVNEHKNALIFQKCQGSLAESVYHISGDLLLAYVKNYYQPCHRFGQTLKYYNNKQDKKEAPLMTKKFIVESLSWEATSLTIKSRNLLIFQSFLNKRYEKLIVKFLNWLGDLKPLQFGSFRLNYEETTVEGLKRQINLKKKMHSFVNILMDYPLNQVKELVMFFAGDDQKSISDKLFTLYKVIKSFSYIVNWGLSLNENLKVQTKSYNETFIEYNKDNFDIVEKMRSYKYCEWRYREVYPKNKLAGKFRRLQRYNTRDQILRYNQGKARIMLALDSFLKNKVSRKIQKLYKINGEHLASIVDEWIVFYMGKINEWVVIRLQHFLDCNINGKVLNFSYWEEEKGQKIQRDSLNKNGRVRELVFANLYEGQFTEQLVEQFSAQIKRNILSYYY